MFQAQLVVAATALAMEVMGALPCAVDGATISFVKNELRSATASSPGAVMSNAKNAKLKNGYQYASEYSIETNLP